MEATGDNGEHYVLKQNHMNCGAASLCSLLCATPLLMKKQNIEVCEKSEFDFQCLSEKVCLPVCEWMSVSPHVCSAVSWFRCLLIFCWHWNRLLLQFDLFSRLLVLLLILHRVDHYTKLLTQVCHLVWKHKEFRCNIVTLSLNLTHLRTSVFSTYQQMYWSTGVCCPSTRPSNRQGLQ